MKMPIYQEEKRFSVSKVMKRLGLKYVRTILISLLYVSAFSEDVTELKIRKIKQRKKNFFDIDC